MAASPVGPSTTRWSRLQSWHGPFIGPGPAAGSAVATLDASKAAVFSLSPRGNNTFALVTTTGLFLEVHPQEPRVRFAAADTGAQQRWAVEQTSLKPQWAGEYMFLKSLAPQGGYLCAWHDDATNTVSFRIQPGPAKEWEVWTMPPSDPLQDPAKKIKLQSWHGPYMTGDVSTGVAAAAADVGKATVFHLEDRGAGQSALALLGGGFLSVEAAEPRIRIVAMDAGPSQRFEVKPSPLKPPQPGNPVTIKNAAGYICAWHDDATNTVSLRLATEPKEWETWASQQIQ
ncbi:hypothetical protein DFJ74DRAFT_693662 [Hyaloraphidium curvatum]|nr:hypothetical protein DFJ74DRAFT_693662 [Hyaloraphidium curvatum]